MLRKLYLYNKAVLKICFGYYLISNMVALGSQSRHFYRKAQVPFLIFSLTAWTGKSPHA